MFVIRVLISYLSIEIDLPISSPLPPATHDYGDHIHEVQPNEREGLPRVNRAVYEDDKESCDGDGKETDVAEERARPDLKRLDDTHRADDNRDDK